MAVQTEMGQGTKPGILIADLNFRPAELDISAFGRADLVFKGVDHSGLSYEVRTFLNNLEADETTPRTVEEGYGGRFVIFGHGGCYGDVGHCEIPTEPRGPYDFRLPHPLTISKDPIRSNRGLTESLFKFDTVDLLTYGWPLKVGGKYFAEVSSDVLLLVVERAWE
jgi:hypothetical protein